MDGVGWGAIIWDPLAPPDANIPSHVRCQDQPPFVNAQDDKSMAQVCNRSHMRRQHTRLISFTSFCSLEQNIRFLLEMEVDVLSS